jgi:hypothetical protein
MRAYDALFPSVTPSEVRCGVTSAARYQSRGRGSEYPRMKILAPQRRPYTVQGEASGHEAGYEDIGKRDGRRGLHDNRTRRRMK